MPFETQMFSPLPQMFPPMVGGSGPPSPFHSMIDPSIDPGRLLFDRLLLNTAGARPEPNNLRRSFGSEFFLIPNEADFFQAQLRERNQQATMALLNSITNGFNGFR